MGNASAGTMVGSHVRMHVALALVPWIALGGEAFASLQLGFVNARHLSLAPSVHITRVAAETAATRAVRTIALTVVAATGLSVSAHALMATTMGQTALHRPRTKKSWWTGHVPWTSGDGLCAQLENS